MADYQIIKIDISPKSPLNFDPILEQAKHSEKPILWQFDFGSVSNLSETVVPSLILGVETFSSIVASKFLDKTEGFLIYRGPLPDESSFTWNFQTNELFENWKREEGNPSFQKRVFLTDLFADYLTRISSSLPADFPVRVVIERGEESLGEFVHLTNKERFEHLDLYVARNELSFALNTLDCQGGFNEAEFEEHPLAVMLPRSNFCDPKGLETLTALLSDLKKEGKPFRLIPEVFFHQMWYRLDQVIALSSSVSTIGQRALSGFTAAGGEILLT